MIYTCFYECILTNMDNYYAHQTSLCLVHFEQNWSPGKRFVKWNRIKLSCRSFTTQSFMAMILNLFILSLSCSFATGLFYLRPIWYPVDTWCVHSRSWITSLWKREPVTMLLNCISCTCHGLLSPSLGAIFRLLPLVAAVTKLLHKYLNRPINTLIYQLNYIIIVNHFLGTRRFLHFKPSVAVFYDHLGFYIFLSSLSQL